MGVWGRAFEGLIEGQSEGGREGTGRRELGGRGETFNTSSWTVHHTGDRYAKCLEGRVLL